MVKSIGVKRKCVFRLVNFVVDEFLLGDKSIIIFVLF